MTRIYLMANALCQKWAQVHSLQLTIKTAYFIVALTDSTELELLAQAAGYRAMFKNTTNHPGRLASYVDRTMSHYWQGTEFYMPTIEIGEVALLSPQDKTVQAYPVTFRWLPLG